MFKYCILLSLLGLAFSQTNPVNVTLYYESRCPGCQYFINSTLPDARQQLGNAMILNMIPYGLAITTWNIDHWEISCDHGNEECFGNALEGCVLQNKSLSFDSQFSFIVCLEGVDNFNKSGPDCATVNNLDWNQLYDCATSDQGFNYELAYGNVTTEFFSQGGLEMVPYVSYNNVKKDLVALEAPGNFISVTCDHIADPKPDVCNK